MRRQNWPEILAAHIAANRRRPFEWGVHDCCTFAADGVLKMTGTDTMAAFRGKYHDQESAALALREIGEGTLQVTMSALLGTPVRARLARRGDVVLTRTATGPAIGLCAGAVAWFAGADGLTHHPLNQCLCAWRID